MGCKPIAHEAKVQMGYRLRGHEYYCFSQIQLVGQN